MFGGPYIDLLDSLALNDDFLRLRHAPLKDPPELDVGEGDRELILRFFALLRKGTQSFRGRRCSPSRTCQCELQIPQFIAACRASRQLSHQRGGRFPALGAFKQYPGGTSESASLETQLPFPAFKQHSGGHH